MRLKAKAGLDARMSGKGNIVTSVKNKIKSAVANVLPAVVLARQHRNIAEPGTAKF
jgi:uncharacterized protein